MGLEPMLKFCLEGRCSRHCANFAYHNLIYHFNFILGALNKFEVI